jgi:hypothetical protein
VQLVFERCKEFAVPAAFGFYHCRDHVEHVAFRVTAYCLHTDVRASPHGRSGYLVAPLYTTTQYYSGLWNSGSGVYLDLSFGTDTSLTTTPGWDNVTGLGVPNGLTFINAVVSAQ